MEIILNVLMTKNNHILVREGIGLTFGVERYETFHHWRQRFAGFMSLAAARSDNNFMLILLTLPELLGSDFANGVSTETGSDAVLAGKSG